MWDTTHPYVRHGAIINVAWIIYMCACHPACSICGMLLSSFSIYICIHAKEPCICTKEHYTHAAASAPCRYPHWQYIYVYTQKSPVYAQKSPVYAQKSPTHMPQHLRSAAILIHNIYMYIRKRALYMRKRALCMRKRALLTCRSICALPLSSFSKYLNRHTCAKQPCTYEKQSYIRGKRVCTQKSPVYTQKSPVFAQQSPVHTNNSPTYEAHDPCIYARGPCL